MTDRKIRRAPSSPSKENDKLDTPKATVTIDYLLEELEQSGRKLRKSNKGYHALLCDTLETAQRIIVELSDNETLQKQFVRAVKKEKKKGRKKSVSFNWSLEIVAKAMGASSHKARKLASKRAGVLEYLRERGVAVKDTAATVKKEGLEKLYSAWCKKKKEKLAEAGNSRHQPAKKDPKRRKIPKDRKVILPLWMKFFEREQLLDQKLGAMLTVLVSRVSEDEGDFKVRHVMVADSLDEAGDWED